MELSKYPSMERVRNFHIEAIQIPIVYNKYGDYDPDGLLYVLEEDAERIRKEALRRFEMETPQPYEEVQPLVIRVNLGDTVKIRFQNRLCVCLARCQVKNQCAERQHFCSQGLQAFRQPSVRRQNYRWPHRESWCLWNGRWPQKAWRRPERGRDCK